MGHDPVVTETPSRRHACCFSGCVEQIDGSRLACIVHWFMLPDALREVLYWEYRSAALGGRSLEEGQPGERPPHRLEALIALARAHWAGAESKQAGRDDGVDTMHERLDRAKFLRRLGLCHGESDAFAGFSIDDVLGDAEAFE